jgi:hypothetical protein
MTRQFFDQIDDQVRGFVGPGLRDFQSVKSSRLIKIWYGDPAVHFEAQTLSGRWSPSPGTCVEVGLHMEAKEAQRNQSILDGLVSSRDKWEAQLPAAEHGSAFGPFASAWRRLSEVFEVDALDEASADEVAERFSAYIVTLAPLLTGKSAPRPETPRSLPRIERY